MHKDLLDETKTSVYLRVCSVYLRVTTLCANPVPNFGTIHCQRVKLKNAG